MINRSEKVGTLKIRDVLNQNFSAKNRTFSKNLYLVPVKITILPIICILHTTIL